MAMDTTTLCGSFTSAGSAVTLVLESGVDWCEVINYTQAATQQATGRGVRYFWQRGMAAGTGIEYKKTNATDALNMVTLSSGGFTLVDSTITGPGPLIAVTSIAGNAGVNGAPRVLVASTAALTTGMIVRLINITGGLQISGPVDFTITVVDATHFDLTNMQSIVSATSGNYRVITPSYWYPRRRVITNISAANPAIITMAVTHGLTIGQQVRINNVSSSLFGMPQINGLTGNIIAINAADANGMTNTITVDIDSSAFTAFTFPVSASVPFTFPEVVPVGENTGVALANPPQNILADSTINTGYTGLILAGGAQSPAGSSSDLIYWKAGKCFSAIVNAPIVNGLITNQF